MKLKLDLHTHCNEATGFEKLSVKVVERLVLSIKAAGLDGIAITDHNGRPHHFEYPFKVKEIVDEYFKDEVLIIPGREFSEPTRHIVELSLPGDLLFRFIAHPGYPISKYWDEDLEGIMGLEIKNGQYPVAEERARELARQHGLLLFSNSDAHRLKDIGKYYNEIDPEDLSKLARPAEKPD